MTEGWSDRRWNAFGDELATAAAVCRERGDEPPSTTTSAPTSRRRGHRPPARGRRRRPLPGHRSPLRGRRGSRRGDRSMGSADQPCSPQGRRRAGDANAARGGAPADELWRQRVCRPLGTGDLRCAEVLAAFEAIGYRGWLVVEQDIFPEPPSMAGQAGRDQETSRRFLNRARAVIAGRSGADGHRARGR